MSAKEIINGLSYLEITGIVLAIVFIFRSKQASKYRSLVAFLGVRLISDIIYFCLFGMAAQHAISTQLAYQLYFYIYWSLFGIEAILSLLLIYDIYRFAMAPLPGLQRLGLLMFKWVAAISLIFSIAISVGPNTLFQGYYLLYAVHQMERAASILTLCLLLFVGFAILPMGLSFRSRIFGVNLGVGLLYTSNIMLTAWAFHSPTLYSTHNIVHCIADCVSIGILAGYFAVEEPVRKFILLPTTSPFLRWNQVSLALGQDPGYVAVGFLQVSFKRFH